MHDELRYIDSFFWNDDKYNQSMRLEIYGWWVSNTFEDLMLSFKEELSKPLELAFYTADQMGKLEFHREQTFIMESSKGKGMWINKLTGLLTMQHFELGFTLFCSIGSY